MSPGEAWPFDRDSAHPYEVKEEMNIVRMRRDKVGENARRFLGRAR
jgi:hypothetical protein